MLQVAEFHANAQVSSKPKKPSLKERKQKLLAFLKGTFSSFPCCVTTLQYHEFARCSHSDNNTMNFFPLTERYEPVYAKWTTERCAVCRWVEDWDYNKIIICNR